MLVTEEQLDPRVKRTRGLLQQALMDLAHDKPLGSITVPTSPLAPKSTGRRSTPISRTRTR